MESEQYSFLLIESKFKYTYDDTLEIDDGDERWVQFKNYLEQFFNSENEESDQIEKWLSSVNT